MLQPRDSFFWQMALRSGLVDAAQLQECWDAIAPDRRTAEAIDRRLARRAVEAGHLTPWQALQIARGRGESIRIGKYVLVGLIGQGGMGRVFLARDTRLNRRVALKVLSQDRRDDPKAIDRFRREARLGAQLQHENLVRVYDEGEVNGHCYLVMEFIEGSSVAQLLAGYGPMPTPTASRLARQVALALEHARQKGMIHRDVNPHNLLVTLDGTAKLTDLGLAIELGDENNLTLDGGLIGNYDYISPEQVRHSREVDSRSDIYSLGCTLYHMVAGRVPFPCPTLPEKIHAQLTAEPPPLGSHVPGLPARFEEVVSRMMRKSPEDRYPDPLAVARALEPFLEGETFAGLTRATSTLHSGAGRRSRDDGQAPTQVYPLVPETVIEAGPSIADRGGFFFSSSSSDPEVPASALPITQTGGLTRTTTSGDGAPARAARRPPSFSGPATGTPGFGAIRPWLARVWSSSPNGWAVVLGLLAATILTSTVLMARPGRRGPGLDPAPGSPARPASGPGRDAPEEPLTVAVVREDGSETPARDLKEALGSGGRGTLRITLRGRGPVRLEAEGLEAVSGSVTIAADPEARPILVVALSGAEPFLRVRARANLKLDGLAIRAEYPSRGGSPPPLIEVKGTLELSRCAFWTTEQAVASRAVTSEGPRLNATGCWFGGFKQCLDVADFAGTEVALDQCMMIRSPGSDPWDSWAVRVRHEPTHAAGDARKLTLRRCTVRDACLLRADDFHPAAPLEVTILETVVQAGALLAWKSESDLSRGCLEWSGQDNRYDLSRADRAIRLEGPSAVPGGSNAPEGWDKLMGERRSQDRPIFFAEAALENRGSPRPEDFPNQVQDGAPIGADPARVGPEPEPADRGPAPEGPDRGA